MVSEWREKGIRFRAIDQAGVTLDGSPTSDLFMNLLMAFSEFETRLRRERQLDGIRAKKEADRSKPKHERTYQGRPATINPTEVRRLAQGGVGASEIARRLQIGRASVYRVLGGTASLGSDGLLPIRAE